MKRKRRVHWSRLILKVLLIFSVLCYSTSMLAVALLNARNSSNEIIADTTPPVIEMIGGDSLTMAVGDVLEEPKIIAYDDSSVPRVEIENHVNITQEGEYKINYVATDDANNVTFAERDVKVIRPTGRIYLTFDDGPSEFTAALLDTLNKNGVKATFFVTGYGDDALIKREYDEGHTVGLHSMSHNYSYIYANRDNFWADLNAVQDRVQNVTGQHTNIMRFPGGSSNMVSAVHDGGQRIMSSLVNEVSEHGYSYFDWNVDSNDAGGAATADDVYNNVVSALGSGGEYVVLQHDVKPFSVDAVERIIQYGFENGFVFSRLRESSFAAHHGVNN